MKKRLSLIIAVLVFVVFSFFFFLIRQKAQTTPFYIVNTTSDTVVAGACGNGSGNSTPGCSLRGAIQTVNATSPSVIIFAIPASDPFCNGGVCTINLTSALPNITEITEVRGPGADKLTVKPATGVNVHIFSITASAVDLSGLTISNGVTSNSSGGGIRNVGGTVNVTNCTISGNSAGTAGGGGIVNGVGLIMNITGSTIINNIGALGGGIENFGLMNVTNSTLAGNNAAGSGGGIFANSGTLNVTNSTIAGNFGTAAGGINNNASTVNVKNSIIALNSTTSTGPDVKGNFVSAGFNLIGKRDGSAGFTEATDLTGTIASPLDPGLDPAGLQNNGGPTKTIALLIGSPAIDKGTSNGLTGILTTDQRGTGFPRNIDDPLITNATGGDGTDIGAFEKQTAAPTRVCDKFMGAVELR